VIGSSLGKNKKTNKKTQKKEKSLTLSACVGRVVRPRFVRRLRRRMASNAHEVDDLSQHSPSLAARHKSASPKEKERPKKRSTSEKGERERERKKKEKSGEIH
jgi:hypothetical protein